MGQDGTPRTTTYKGTLAGDDLKLTATREVWLAALRAAAVLRAAAQVVAEPRAAVAVAAADGARAGFQAREVNVRAARYCSEKYGIAVKGSAVKVVR